MKDNEINVEKIKKEKKKMGPKWPVTWKHRGRFSLYN